MKSRRFEHGIDLLKPVEGYERTPGLHMSDIYNDLYKGLMPDIFDQRDEDGNEKPMDGAKVSFGTGFESVFEPALARYYFGERPGEFATQHARDCLLRRTRVRVGDPTCRCGAGVIYSPDYFFFTPKKGLVLGEFKLTWFSGKDFPDHRKFDKWRCQVKAYGYHVHSALVWLFPFWVNGGIDGAYFTHQAEFKYAWELEFSARELVDNWQMLVAHARKKGML